MMGEIAKGIVLGAKAVQGAKAVKSGIGNVAKGIEKYNTKKKKMDKPHKSPSMEQKLAKYGFSE